MPFDPAGMPQIEYQLPGIEFLFKAASLLEE